MKLKSTTRPILFSMFIGYSTIVQAQYVGQGSGQLKIPAIATKVSSFDLQAVRLLDGKFLDNTKRNGKWLLTMDTKRLLHSWRVNAGIASNVKALGGWETLDCELRGHTLGHVLSGLSLMYASTGEPAYKLRGDSLVNALAQCQDILKQNGYLSAFPQYFIDRCIAGQPVWAPWYTLHKVLAGLVDMYVYTENKKALEVAVKMSSWAYQKLSPLTPEQLTTMKRNEFGGMEETCYNLYAITGNIEDKKLAEMFRDDVIMTPLLHHEDKLARLHANTQIPKITGEARGYEFTGNKDQREIAEFFFKTVNDHHTYVIGGNSDDEHFFEADKLSLHMSARTTETCNTYNMLKLARHLFSWNPDVKYADYYERALYNHILAAQDPETGMASYFMPFKPGLFKVYSTPTNSFWCCVGTAFESNAKFAEAIYYHDDNSIFVNLFIPSELNWKNKRVTITQRTNYPEESSVQFSIDKSNGQNFPINIRYPGWCKDGASVKLNGKSIVFREQPGSYIKLERKWKQGDKIEVNFPMSLSLVSTNDNVSKSAIVYGPIVLAGEMGTEGLTQPVPYAGDANDFNNYFIPEGLITALNTKGQDIKGWLKRLDGKELIFKTRAVSPRDLTLIPYYKLHGERYVIYWDIQ